MIALYRYVKTKRTRRLNETSKSAPAPSTDNVHPESQLKHQNTSSDAVKAQAKAANKYRWKLNLCLWLPFFLSSLDLTVVATALPYIANHFDEFNQLNWAVTSFTLTSTAFIPVFGQLANTFGRHSSLQLAVWAITIGSVICAAAPSWAVLLLGRAVQGIGTAGVQNVVLIILADKVSLKEQAKNTSIFQMLSGIGYAVGPVIGGYLTDADWRYCFVLPACIGAVSIVTVFLLRKDLVHGSVSISHPRDGRSRFQSLLDGLKTIDFGGAFLFIAAVTLIILGTAWGGSTYPWVSAAVIAPIVIGAVLFAIFALYEYLLEPGRYLATLMPKTTPMIPVKILRNKDVSIISAVAAGSGAALYSVFYFIGIYFILVEGDEASHAGVQLLYYVPGLGVGVYSAIFLVNKWPAQTFFPLNVGTIIETAGIAALTYAVKSRDGTLVNVMMAIAGVGTGLRFMPSNIHLAGMCKDNLAAAYSMLRFSMPFGGTLALTIMGAVFQNKMSRYFGAAGTGDSEFNLHNTAALNAITDMPEADQQVIRSTGADATMWAFISILPFIGLSMIVCFGLGNVWISRSKTESVGNSKENVLGQDGKVDQGYYLLNIIVGRRQQEQVTSVTESSNLEPSGGLGERRV